MQKKPRNGLKETKERTDFIIANYNRLSDYEMGMSLNVSKGGICGYRTWLRLYRGQRIELTNSQKAKIAETYFNTYSLKECMKLYGNTYFTVSRFISNNMLFKRQTENTEVMVFKSKV